MLQKTVCKIASTWVCACSRGRAGLFSRHSKGAHDPDSYKRLDSLTHRSESKRGQGLLRATHAPS